MEINKEKNIMKPLVLWALFYFLFIFIFFSSFIYPEIELYRKLGFRMPEALSSHSNLVFFFILTGICQFLYKISKVYRARVDSILGAKK